MSTNTVHVEAIKSDIRKAVINEKANACPMVVRLAWHASGTFDKKDNSGGSNGAGMRFEPESTDGANAGLSIVRDMLLKVKKDHPEITFSDLWAVAGCSAVDFMGGPKIPVNLGRTDFADGKYCPPNGRLPDASQGAEHLRDVFGRMGFNDQEIVALSGAHTLGRCHRVRSGFDGPWTRQPLKFDNTYFKNLMHLEWQPKKWDGPFQYEDKETGELMMLPTDMVLRTDPSFRKYAEIYANDEQKFFDDFALAFHKLVHLGVKTPPKVSPSQRAKAGLEFREAAMHGSLDVVKKYSRDADIDELEANSKRTALHKASFWGHIDTVKFIVNDCHAKLDLQDVKGDTALHDAARFGHRDIVQFLVNAGASTTIRNKDGKTAQEVALQYDKPELTPLFTRGVQSRL